MEIPAARIVAGLHIAGIGVVTQVHRFAAEVASRQADRCRATAPQPRDAPAIARLIAEEVAGSYTQTLGSIAVEGLGFRRSYRPEQRVAVIRPTMLA